MLRLLTLLLAVTVLVSSQGQNRLKEEKPSPSSIQNEEQFKTQEQMPRQLVYLSERQQQFNPGFQQYPFGLLNPQYQFPSYNFLPNDNSQFSRVQPQLLIYPNGVVNPSGQGYPGGQTFVYQAAPPPGTNFIYPQGPGVVLRDLPQRPPVFLAGYPKPAHIPPVEKDAEEIPTNPAMIPPFNPVKPGNTNAINPGNSEKRPEKLETFNENDKPGKEAGEAPELAGSDKPNILPRPNPPQLPRRPSIPNIPTMSTLRPGQRFFILNGVPLFSNYPFADNNPQYNSRYTQPNPHPVFPHFQAPQNDLPQTAQANVRSPIETLLFRNSITGQISDINSNAFQEQAETLQPVQTRVNRPKDTGRQDLLFKNNFPFTVESKNNQDNVQLRFSEKEFKLQPVQLYDPAFNGGIQFLQYQEGDENNDAVVIEAATRDDIKSDQSSDNSNSETVQAADANSEDSSISQAQPSAIALAGPGGAASAAPRGTAIVGKGGLALSSPQASAVAGPNKESEDYDEESIKKRDDKGKIEVKSTRREFRRP